MMNDTTPRTDPSALTVLFAPAHVLVDETQAGSEYHWPYKLIERLALDHGVRVIALTVRPQVETQLPGVQIVSVDPGGPLPMSHLERLRFHLRIYATARRILAAGRRIAIVHHMLPFGFRATFNLLALQHRRGDPPLIIGPLQSPLSWTGGDEARVAVRDFSPADSAPPRRRTLPPLSSLAATPVLSALSARTLHRAAALVAISEQAARLYGSVVPSRQISVIPAGVDTQEFTPWPRREEGSARHDRRPVDVVAVGYLVQRKAFDVLIAAVAELVRLRLPVHLRLIGDGPARSSLEGLVRRLGIEQAVTFAGLIPHEAIVREYQRAHIFCSPSLSESFSSVGLEAMSCGLPVVATPTGLFRHALRREHVGVLVRFGAVDDLASALAQLITNRPLCEVLGRQARELAMREYDWGVVARRYLALYEQAIRVRV